MSDVADVFAVPLCQVSTSVPYIRRVACLAVKFIYPTSIVVWYFFWILGFDALLYCVCAFESDVNVCMSKEIGKLSDFWAVVCKCCPILFSSFVVLALETYNDRHCLQLLIQPPDRTKRSLPLSYQQNAVTPTNRRKTTDRMGNNTTHTVEI